MSERTDAIELQPNGLPVDIKDWSEDQLLESYFYLEDRPVNELNASAMLSISKELDRRNESAVNV